MFILQVDNTYIIVTRQVSVLSVLNSMRKVIPSFCYHPKLALEGNCRMCLVEVFKMPKPVASCCLPIQHNMKIFTNTPLVHKARENALEFLLANHPLDCPVCDQGGECDLQDYTFGYSSRRSRFFGAKASISNKYYNLYIKVIMNRCITCTKCVRLVDVLVGKSSLGSLNRGKNTEIGGFISSFSDFEFSGNLVDICPVGALTAKSYSFKNRPWEVVNRFSIDLFDGYGMPISVETNLSKIERILPQSNVLLNDKWINNRIRFCIDSVNDRIFSRPSYKYNSKSVLFYWSSMLRFLKSIISLFSNSTKFYFSNTLDLYSLFLIKQYNQKFQCFTVSDDSMCTVRSFPKMFLFNNLQSLKNFNSFFSFGLNLRLEISNLNLKLLKESQKHLMSLSVFGPVVNLGYSYDHFGSNLKNLISLVTGLSSSVLKFKSVLKLMFFFNSRLFTRFDGFSLYFLVSKLIKTKFNSIENPIRIVQVEANKAGSLMFGLPEQSLTVTQNKHSLLQNVQLLSDNTLKAPLTVNYQYTNLKETTSSSLIELPLSTSFEFSGLYVNTDGFVQRTYPCFLKSGENKPNFVILKNLFNQFFKSVTHQNKFFNLINGPTYKDILFDCFLMEDTFKYLYVLDGFIPSYIENFYSSKLLTRSITMIQYSVKSRSESNWLDL